MGALAQVRIRIQNSGSIEATGTFVGQVTLDGTVVQAIESPPRFIASGEEDSVDVFVEVPSEGEYRVAGTVNFEGFESDEAELVFTVGDAGGSDGSSLGLILGIVAGVVVVAGAAAFLLRRRRSA